MAPSIENGAPGRNAEDVSGKRIGTELPFFGLAIKQTKASGAGANAGPATLWFPFGIFRYI